MHFFKRPKRPPLAEAIFQTGEAMRIATDRLQKRNDVPTPEELQQLEQLADFFWRHSVEIRYIIRRLEERMKDA
jgi:hypothetical protein